jgi:hypothetical protein
MRGPERRFVSLTLYDALYTPVVVLKQDHSEVGHSEVGHSEVGALAVVST